MITELKTMTAGAFNAITVPPGTPELLVIVPPSTNALAMTLKGVTGDTGILLAPGDPSVVSLATTITSIGLTIGAGSDFTVALGWL